MLHMPTPMLIMGPSGPPPGQQVFTAASTDWVVPEGVITISAVAIGRGGDATFDGSLVIAGASGAIIWLISLAVTPGETLNVFVSPSFGSGLSRGGTTLLRAGAAVNGSRGFVYVGNGGNDGGRGASSVYGSVASINGAGASGYTSEGQMAQIGGDATPYGGGGMSIMGGAFGGASSGANYPSANGGSYGGGGGVSGDYSFAGLGGPGGVRIIWGEGRAYPNTNTGNM